MVTVKKAKELIHSNLLPLRYERKTLKEALGYILAQDIRAPFPLPLYDNSAMDGFTLRAKDTQEAGSRNPISLKIIGTIKAGDQVPYRLNSKQTYRIMTGAPIPKGADTVLPKEEAVVQNNRLVIHHPLSSKKHIRFQGEELRKRTLVLKKCSPVHPGTIGILASLGLGQVKVFRKPSLSLITTGSELIHPGQDLKPGKIYDSNSKMIEAALIQMGISPVRVQTIQDEKRLIQKTIRMALKRSDVILITGGVSVGDYDYAKDILKGLGVKTIFWKVQQKPGKPLYFGRNSRVLVFGLPGNPASVFTCFYEYVYPMLREMAGFERCNLDQTKVTLRKQVKADPQKLLFLKARISFDHGRLSALPLSHQGSHMISSLQIANGLALIKPQKGRLKKGREVLADMLPYHQEVR